METLTNLSETARILRCSISTLRRELRRGFLPCHRIGNGIFFTKQDVTEYLKNKRQPAKEVTV